MKTSYQMQEMVHIFSSNEKSSLKFCEFCRKKFYNLYDYKEHLNVHRDDYYWYCVFCAYQSSKKDNVLRHIKAHYGEKPFLCVYCSYRTLHKCDLKKHLKSYHDL